MLFQTIGAFRLIFKKLSSTKKHSNFTDAVLIIIKVYAVLKTYTLGLVDVAAISFDRFLLRIENTELILHIN